jgi:hypothetical protein
MISIDTVYQKVLALANKEQRGYITPQEYNLFANHAQMEIFEQYFYDLNQFNRVPGNSTEYSDMLSVLQEKLSVLEARVAGIDLTNTVSGVAVTGNQYQPVGTGNGPSIGQYFFFNIVAMNTFLGRSNYSGAVNTYFERTQKIKQYRLNTTTGVYDLIFNGKVLLNSDSTSGYTSGGAGIGIGRRENGFGLGQWLVGDIIADEKSSIFNFRTSTLTPNLYKLGTVTTTQGKEIEQVNNNEWYLMNLSPLTTPTISRPVYVNRANGIHLYPDTINEIDISYIIKPNTVNWSYVVINNKPLYTPTGSVHFELHASEETELVYRILGLAGIAIEKPQLTQVATGLQGAAIQQEKQ